jgi:single stranded DNA-binding protein
MLNKTELIGYLGRDVEINYTASGLAVAKVSLGTNEKWTDKNTGEKREKTEWHNLVAFGKRAEAMAQFVGKGSMVYICGKLRYRTWEYEGRTCYRTEIEVSDVKFLSRPKEVTSAPTHATTNAPTHAPAPAYNVVDIAAQYVPKAPDHEVPPVGVYNNNGPLY